MDYKGFKAQIMKAERLIGSGVHGLPPGRPIDVYPVDAFKKPLDNWVKGAGNYVIPVDSDWGLWFDWTMNDQMNTAVLPSVKGMNPITGRRTNGHVLERYEDKCPEHGVKFSDGLYCEKCNFKWPAQNYVAYPNTLWWDGFRSADGKVRQFFFTEDLAKSIPELVIGKEDTVPAFGFAFYRTKVVRAMITRSIRYGSCTTPGIYYHTSSDGLDIKLGNSSISHDNNFVGFCNSSAKGFSSGETSINYCVSSVKSAQADFTVGSQTIQDNVLKTIKKHRLTKAEVGVGAGAEISQDVQIDSLKLSDWEDKPTSIMRLYFIFIEQFEDIKSKGLRDLTGVKNGYLEGLPVG